MFFIKTDKKSLKFLLDQRFTHESQHPWLKKLTEFDYLVKYRKEKENLAADVLFRRGFNEDEVPILHCTALFIVQPAWLSRIQELV